MGWDPARGLGIGPGTSARRAWRERRDAGGSDELGRRDGDVELERWDAMEAWWPVGYGEGERTHPHREHKPGFERMVESAVFRMPPKSPQSGLQ